MTAGELKAAVLARYGSIHAFCRRHAEVKRSTAYMVLAGRYPGRTAAQQAKICAALAGADIINAGDTKESSLAPVRPVPSPEMLGRALQNIRCNHCRTLDKSRCSGCRTQTMREAEELNMYLVGEL